MVVVVVVVVVCMFAPVRAAAAGSGSLPHFFLGSEKERESVGGLFAGALAGWLCVCLLALTSN